MNDLTQKNRIVVAVDAMGGDNAPASVLGGVKNILKRREDIYFKVFGNEEEISNFIDTDKFFLENQNFEVIHTDISITADEKPANAIRKGRNSSMGLGIKSLRKNTADCFVSAGNTGALMAMSKIMLDTLPNVSRPAICTVFPTIKRDVVMLDLGANVLCDEENLFEFALMGDVFARKVLGEVNPSIAILNIGSEEIKGHDTVRNAALLIKESDMSKNFIGYVEGDDIGQGIADIIVTDGFSGNIALKTAEGTAKVCAMYLKDSFTSSWYGKIIGFLAKPVLKKLKTRIDPRSYNGAMFLGLDGVVVKSHGNTDSTGFSNAVNVAISLVENKVCDYIIDEMSHFKDMVDD